MSVSKRLRYEVLRRDDHRCRYCGAGASDAALHVDHVVPVALGGGDQPENLVTACSNCNVGKSSTAPDGPIVEGVTDDAIRWASAMEHAAQIQRDDSARMDEIYAQFFESWLAVYSLPNDWRRSVSQFVQAGADMELLYDAMDAAFAAPGITWRWKYFCGIAWSKLRERQQIAAELIARDGE